MVVSKTQGHLAESMRLRLTPDFRQGPPRTAETDGEGRCRGAGEPRLPCCAASMTSRGARTISTTKARLNQRTFVCVEQLLNFALRTLTQKHCISFYSFSLTLEAD